MIPAIIVTPAGTQRSRGETAGRPMPARSEGEPCSPAERHRAAVAGSLRFATASAARGDYRDALGWLRVLEAVGEELPVDYLAKRRAWQAAVDGTRPLDRVNEAIGDIEAGRMSRVAPQP